MTKLEQLIAEVRRLAAEAPDVEYVPPTSKPTCFYTRGKTANGGCGCLFGQALQNVFPNIWQQLDAYERENDCPYGSIPFVLADYDFRMPSEGDDTSVQRQVNWCRRVQKLQDGDSLGRTPWGRAVAQADEEFEVSKNPL